MAKVLHMMRRLSSTLNCNTDEVAIVQRRHQGGRVKCARSVSRWFKSHERFVERTAGSSTSVTVRK